MARRPANFKSAASASFAIPAAWLDAFSIASLAGFPKATRKDPLKQRKLPPRERNCSARGVGDGSVEDFHERHQCHCQGDDPGVVTRLPGCRIIFYVSHRTLFTVELRSAGNMCRPFIGARLQGSSLVPCIPSAEA